MQPCLPELLQGHSIHSSLRREQEHLGVPEGPAFDASHSEPARRNSTDSRRRIERAREERRAEATDPDSDKRDDFITAAQQPRLKGKRSIRPEVQCPEELHLQLVKRMRVGSEMQLQCME